MTNRFPGLLVSGALVAGLLVPTGQAFAAELAELCWLTDRGTILRLAVTQSGASHYTYTGFFDDGDGASYAVVGQASQLGSTIEGSFSGSLSTPSAFKTGIWHVSFSPALAISMEGIRQVYVRGTDPALVNTAYRTHTATPTPCP